MKKIKTSFKEYCPKCGQERSFAIIQIISKKNLILIGRCDNCGLETRKEVFEIGNYSTVRRFLSKW